MNVPFIIAHGAAVNEQREPKVPSVTSLLRLALPAEGDIGLGAAMQVLVKTEHGLEMKCFQY